MKLLTDTTKREGTYVVSRARLPTRAGHFEVVAFASAGVDLPHLALVRGGDLTGSEDVPVRVHTECLRGDALGSLACDCRAELELALDALGEEPRGVLLYLRESGDGRGLGLHGELSAEHEAHGDALCPRHDSALLTALVRALGVASVAAVTSPAALTAGARADAAFAVGCRRG